MIDRITIGAASLTASLVAAVGVARWWVSPITTPGRHRAGDPLFRPCNVADNRPAYCLVQQRTTDHAVLAGGLLICWECRNHTIAPQPVPASGEESQ